VLQGMSKASVGEVFDGSLSVVHGHEHSWVIELMNLLFIAHGAICGGKLDLKFACSPGRLVHTGILVTKTMSGDVDRLSPVA
jgi:hypothetical protein